MVQCNLCIAGGPEDGIISNTPFASSEGSSHMEEYQRHVVVIPCFAREIFGRVTKYCLNSTSFENPASRDTCLQLLNSTELSLCTERGRFLDAISKKSEVSSLERLVTSSCEMLTFMLGESTSFTTSFKIPRQDCSVNTELFDCHDGLLSAELGSAL